MPLTTGIGLAYIAGDEIAEIGGFQTLDRREAPGARRKFFMNGKHGGWVLALSLSVVAAGCQSAGYHKRQGSLIGGMTGTAIGALAGANQGKALEGAAIGALAGGTMGGAIGNEIDRDEAYQQAAYNQAVQGAVSVNQVIQMAQSGLDEQLIINQIQASGVAARPTSQDLLVMQNSGVSQRVIGAMQVAPLAGVPGRVIYRSPPPGPVIIHDPCYWDWHHHHPHHYHHGWHSDVHFDF
jgi:hypothetical protein